VLLNVPLRRTGRGCGAVGADGDAVGEACVGERVHQLVYGAPVREGEAYGLAEKDIVYEDEVIHIRRQIKRVDGKWIFALPKGGKQRDVPLAPSTATVLRSHIEMFPPVSVTLPWAKATGELRTYRLVFVHPNTHAHLRAMTYSPFWLPALAAAGLLGPDGLGKS
jgi:integrase